MPYKDPVRRRDYHRQYDREHPRTQHESPEARERRIAAKKEYEKTPRGKEIMARAKAKWAATERGQKAIRRAQAKYLASPRARLRWQRYNAAKMAVPNDLSVEDWADILFLFDGRCAYCMRPDLPLTMDHVVPVSRGGPTTTDNIVPACRPCNSSKGARL